MAADYDLVIRGGDIADGLGSPLRRGDVAINGTRIAAVGEVNGRGREEIDATGAVVAPGVVDIHTHYDGQAVWDSHLASSSWHGVTTVVTGNCGVGFAPVRPQDRDSLIELMEGVEDIPGAVLGEGLDWQWESFAEYLAAIDRLPHDMDICAQLPHAPLRVYVMGERALRLEAANDDDVAQMRSLARDAMLAGAIGFSSSRSINHRSAGGDPTPSLRASESELLGIALGLRDAGRGVLQILSDFDTPAMDEEFAMLRRIVEASGRPMSLGLVQKHDDPEAWRRLMALINGAVADGLPFRAQVAPRAVGVLYGLQASFTPFSGTKAFSRIAGKPHAEKVATMRDPAFRAQLLEEVGRRARRRVDYSLIFPFGSAPDYEPRAEQSIAAEAARRGITPDAAAYDRLLEDDGRRFLYAPAMNYRHGNLDVCREMIAEPNAVIGLGDGGAHVGFISDSSIPTFLMTHWSKECGRPDGFDLSWLIKRQTSDTARAVGLLDRGVIAPGMKADINIFEPGELALECPEVHFDLPAGGRRLLQRARGYRATLVSGQITCRDGESSGNLPGRLVRGPQELAV